MSFSRLAAFHAVYLGGGGGRGGDGAGGRIGSGGNMFQLDRWMLEFKFLVLLGFAKFMKGLPC